MPYESSLCRASREKQIENIFIKLSNDCFSKADQKYSIGGVAPVKYVSKRALDALIAEVNANPKTNLPENLIGNFGRCKGFIFDHCIPVELVWRWFTEDASHRTRDAVSHVIDSRAICYELILKDEDGKLNAHGLRSKMPHSWNGQLSVDNVLLRCQEAGIDVVDVNEALQAINAARSEKVDG